MGFIAVRSSGGLSVDGCSTGPLTFLLRIVRAMLSCTMLRCQSSETRNELRVSLL